MIVVHEQVLSRDHVSDDESRGSKGRRTLRELDSRRHATGLGVILLAQMAVVGYLVSRSYFFAEDFTFLKVFGGTPLSPDLLRTSTFGHLVPGFILVQRYFGDWFGANWTLAAFAIVAIQLAGTVAFARMLVALVGRRTWWTLWLTAAFGLSVVVLNTAPWWGAIWTMQITLAASVSSWGCALRYQRTRDWRHLLALAVMFTIAVAFFEKAVLTSAYLGLFVLFVGTNERESFAVRIRRTLGLWPVWLIIATISAADLLLYASGPYLSESGDPAGLGITAQYLARTLPEGTFPALIGAVYPASTLPGPGILTVVVATAATLAVVLWTSFRSGLALRTWVWYFVVALMSQGIVARGRLSLFDLDTVLHNLRYQGDTIYLFLIALAIAVPAALQGAAPSVRRRSFVVAIVAPLLVLPLWLQSVHTISEQSPGRSSKAYFSALRTGEIPKDAAFLDLPVSPWVIPPQMYPWNMASKVFPVVRPGTKVTHDLDGAYRIDDDGSVLPVVLADLTTPTSGQTCVSPGHGPQRILSLPQAEQPSTGPLMLALRYHVHGRARIQLAAVGGGAAQEIRGTGELFRVAGTNELVTVIAPPSWDTVSLMAVDGHEVCVDSVRLVALGG